MLPVSNRCQTCLIICALKKTSNIHKVGMFHSEATDEKKSDIIKKLQAIANCHAVILFGIPSITTDMVQEVCRIGRGGKESIALLLYNKHHMQHANVRFKHNIHHSVRSLKLSLHVFQVLWVFFFCNIGSIQSTCPLLIKKRENHT